MCDPQVENYCLRHSLVWAGGEGALDHLGGEATVLSLWVLCAVSNLYLIGFFER